MDLASLAREAGSGDPPGGPGERFAGYGIMGLPFASGHVLALRRFVSSIGPTYTSVWHRSPAREWTFWQDQESRLGCGRYFSAAVASVTETEIVLTWPAADELRVSVPAARLEWRAVMRSTLVMSAFNALGALVPDRAWRRDRLLGALGPAAGRALGLGPIRLVGQAPNGQSFVANPLRIWSVAASTATLDGEDLGAPGPLTPQAALGGFVIPQRGIFAIGRAFFR